MSTPNASSIGHEQRPCATSPRQELETSCILAALSGSAAALRRLCQHYAPLVRAVVARRAWLAGRGRDVDDLCQDVWCRLLARDRRLLRYFEPGRGSFGGFLRMLARQQVGQSFGPARHHVVFDEAEPPRAADVHDPEASAVEAVLARRLVEHARHSLSERDVVLLERHLIEGTELCALARELGVSHHALYKRHQRLMHKLPRMLDTLPDCSECHRSSNPRWSRSARIHSRAQWYSGT